MSDFNFDLNDAGEQRSVDVIPANTICTVQMTIKPGGAGAGWLADVCHTKKGYSEHLNCEFVVVDGPMPSASSGSRFTVDGTNHADSERDLAQDAQGDLGKRARHPPQG